MDSSAILTEDQQQALLELLKEISSVFWGPDQKKCVALLKESFFDPFEKINALAGFQMSKALTAIGSIKEICTCRCLKSSSGGSLCASFHQ